MELQSIIGLVILCGVALVAFVFATRKKKPNPPVTPPVGDEVKPPIAYKPFLTVLSPDWKEKVTIDMRYQVHGCDHEGTPTLLTGAYDPDGLPLEHRITVRGPDENKVQVNYAVFGRPVGASKPVRIDGQWVTFPRIKNPNGRVTEDALAVVIVGNENTDAGSAVNVLCEMPPVPVEATRPDNPVLGSMTVTYTVRNSKGLTASASISTPVTKLACN